jgi:hypothetical protein
MKRLQQIYQVARVLVFSLAFWASVATVAWAKRGAPEAKEEGGWFLLSYAMVLLGIGLGMLVVCRSARRRERDKPELYGENKLLED